MLDDRRIVADDASAIDDRGQLARGLQGVLATGLGEEALQPSPARAGILDPREEWLGRRQDGVVGDVRVPDIDEAHGRERSEPLAVGADGGYRGGPVLGRAEAVGPTRDDDARGEALDVPLPGTRQRLVEVVGIEHQAPLG